MKRQAIILLLFLPVFFWGQQNKQTPQLFEGVIPPGSSVRCRLIYVADVPQETSGAGSRMFVGRLEGWCYLPNRRQVWMDDAFVIGYAVAENVNDRALLQFKTLSYYFKDNLYIESINAFAYYKGRLGVPGSRKIDKEAENIVKIMGASILQAMQQIIAGYAQRSVFGPEAALSTNLITTPTTQVFNQLAQYYLSMINTVMPVLEVTNNMLVDCVFRDQFVFRSTRSLIENP